MNLQIARKYQLLSKIWPYNGIKAIPLNYLDLNFKSTQKYWQNLNIQRVNWNKLLAEEFAIFLKFQILI